MFLKIQYLFSIILFLVFQVPVKEAKKPCKTIVFISAETTVDRLYFEEYNVRIGSDKTSLDIDLRIGKNFTLDAWIFLTVSLKSQPKNDPRPLFQYDLNLCNILGQKGTRMKGFLTPWLKNFWDSSNLPKSCPLSQGNYSWHGLRMDNLNMPSFLPSSRYEAIVSTYVHKGASKLTVGSLKVLSELK